MRTVLRLSAAAGGLLLLAGPASAQVPYLYRGFNNMAARVAPWYGYSSPSQGYYQPSGPGYPPGYPPGSSPNYPYPSMPPGSPPPPVGVSGNGTIYVTVPSADARVWLDGTEMPGSGYNREFAVHGLTHGARHDFKVTATWTSMLETTTQERMAHINGIGKGYADFRGPPPAAPPTPSLVATPDSKTTASPKP